MFESPTPEVRREFLCVVRIATGRTRLANNRLVWGVRGDEMFVDGGGFHASFSGQGRLIAFRITGRISKQGVRPIPRPLPDEILTSLLKTRRIALPVGINASDLTMEVLRRPEGFRIVAKRKFEGLVVNAPMVTLDLEAGTGRITEIRTFRPQTEVGFFSRPRLTWKEARALVWQELRLDAVEVGAKLSLEPQATLGGFRGYRPVYGKNSETLTRGTDAVPVYLFQLKARQGSTFWKVRVDARRKRVMEVITSSASPTAR